MTTVASGLADGTVSGMLAARVADKDELDTSTVSELNLILKNRLVMMYGEDVANDAINKIEADLEGK